MSTDTTTTIGVATAIATAFSSVVGYLAKKLFDVLDNEKQNTSLERARGDRLEAEIFKMQEKTILSIEAISSTVKEHISLIKDRRRDVP